MEGIEVDLRFMLVMEFDTSVPWENLKPSQVNVPKRS